MNIISLFLSFSTNSAFHILLRFTDSCISKPSFHRPGWAYSYGHVCSEQTSYSQRKYIWYHFTCHPYINTCPKFDRYCSQGYPCASLFCHLATIRHIHLVVLMCHGFQEIHFRWQQGTIHNVLTWFKWYSRTWETKLQTVTSSCETFK